MIRAGSFDEETLAAVEQVLVGSCDGHSTERIVDMVERALDK